MKKIKPLQVIILAMLALAVLDGFTQTIYKNIPIQCDDAYIVKVWALNEEVNAWSWYSITDTNIESKNGWYFNQEINIKINRYDEGHFLFIRGFEDCRDTTNLTLYGAFNKETIKDRKDLRVLFNVDGGSYTLGTKIDKP